MLNIRTHLYIDSHKFNLETITYFFTFCKIFIAYYNKLHKFADTFKTNQKKS